MDEELCLVDSETTNSILRETKYFQTLTKKKGNILTIARRDATIVGTGRATIVLPMGTHITIEDALLYPDSKRTLLSYKVIRQNGFQLKPVMTITRNFSSLLKITDMANKLLNKFLLFRPDCTTHTLNPYHMLRIR